MTIIDCLTGDHREIRRALDGMRALLRDADPDSGPCCCVTLKSLLELQSELLSRLQLHEILENRCLMELMRELGPEGEEAAQAMAAEHDSVRDGVKLLSALEGMGSAYQVRSALSSLALTLENHMAIEESRFFPLILRLADPGKLEAARRQAERMLDRPKT